MPHVTFDGKTFSCAHGANLRRVLLDERLRLYNGNVKRIHCRGLGTCGTCAVRIEGKTSPPTRIERWRLNFPPHNELQGLRLACQVRVEGDLVVEKLEGIWGNKE